MIRENETSCPDCGGILKHYDRVSRMMRTKGGLKRYLKIRRFKCAECKKLHRELPDDIYPYKQYEADIIQGVIDGFITSDTIGFEDYPCEVTMGRWVQLQFT